eukprot:g29287.t1
MGIGRDSRHKHYKTGGRSKTSIKKHSKEMGRPATPCKLGAKRVRRVRCRGGNILAEENVTKKVRILDVVYNATSNELVRTKTLLKNTVEKAEDETKRSRHVIFKQKARASKTKLEPWCKTLAWRSSSRVAAS